MNYDLLIRIVRSQLTSAPCPSLENADLHALAELARQQEILLRFNKENT